MKFSLILLLLVGSAVALEDVRLRRSEGGWDLPASLGTARPNGNNHLSRLIEVRMESAHSLVSGLDAVGFNVSVMLPLDEAKFSMAASTEWMRRHWTRSFAYAACYVLVIFAGQLGMKKRPRFELRLPLVAWNLVLGGFSLMGCVRTYPEFFSVLTKGGFHESVCNANYTRITVTSYWAWLFALSKVLELGDTIFIVLRKQELIFLHWYHHITVLVYTWYSFKEHTAPGRWFIVMNYSVHSLMYTYYALRALKIRMPRFVPMTITALQLLQMIIGTAIGVYTYGAMRKGYSCQQNYENIKYQLLMYASYFVLFAHFFYKAYFRNGKFSISAAHSRVGSSASSASSDSSAFSESDFSARLPKAKAE